MADEGNILTDLGNGPAGGAGDPHAGNGADTSPAIGLISQYVKDFSVENPNSPKSYQWTDQHELDVQFNINATGIDEEVSEVALKVVITSKTAQGTVYIIELTYCGLIGMRNVPEAQGHAFLYAEAPRILFPFVRRIVSDAVRDAGYPPLLLDPIDFAGLYQQQMEQRRQQQAAAGQPMGEA
ncbi:protein-export chaperone SecB [Croceicoccus mobilis]|uniref:Protein-export protein SecB n=1 Tax=Croceicoccus mobilis TaxID=1703339 RepID=A0A917DR53_9SPHN|nr:protein-export chaperone SecB [Croceicoccus mobilis]GGD59109.1 protein-export protein SecB [Croceicoccus mobilis]